MDISKNKANFKQYLNKNIQVTSSEVYFMAKVCFDIKMDKYYRQSGEIINLMDMGL